MGEFELDQIEKFEFEHWEKWRLMLALSMFDLPDFHLKKSTFDFFVFLVLIALLLVDSSFFKCWMKMSSL